jgi:hypothetical protein
MLLDEAGHGAGLALAKKRGPPIGGRVEGSQHRVRKP